jgi:hypothetical protein
MELTLIIKATKQSNCSKTKDSRKKMDEGTANSQNERKPKHNAAQGDLVYEKQKTKLWRTLKAIEAKCRFDVFSLAF